MTTTHNASPVITRYPGTNFGQLRFAHDSHLPPGAKLHLIIGEKHLPDVAVVDFRAAVIIKPRTKKIQVMVIHNNAVIDHHVIRIPALKAA